MPLEEEILGNKRKKLPGASACPTQATPSIRGSSECLSPACPGSQEGSPVAPAEAGPAPSAPLGEGCVHSGCAHSLC